MRESAKNKQKKHLTKTQTYIITLIYYAEFITKFD